MALQVAVKNKMLDTMKGYFKKLYLAQNATGGAVTLDMALNNPAVLPKIGNIVGKDLTWGAADASAVATTNTYQSNPLNFSVPGNATLIQLYLTDDNATQSARVIYGIITIPSPSPTYPSGDGAYYVRGITISLAEV